MTTYQNILTRTEGRVGIVQLNRPHALNALNGELMSELLQALQAFETDASIGCLIITGNEKAFAAGADIKQMANATAVEMMSSPFISYWDGVKQVSKPLIAAVSGWCLGGGCELAMICDTIIASETAKFGQPEINLAVIPGAGGTQRLTRAVGKAIAMDVILGDRKLTAQEALQFSLVSRVAPVDQYMQVAVEVATSMASKSPIALRVAKEAINAAFEVNLNEGVLFERRLFNLLFATDDQKEGMSAFVEKRPAVWKGK